MPVTYVLYHSREWDTLVETGWITALVDWWPAHPFGPIVAWATMVRP
jgi:hypothetical protein